MVARQTLTLFVWVQILVPQPTKPLDTNGLNFRGVAQLGRALGSGPRGREFESRHSDHTASRTSFVRDAVFYVVMEKRHRLTHSVAPPLQFACFARKLAYASHGRVKGQGRSSEMIGR